MNAKWVSLSALMLCASAFGQTAPISTPQISSGVKPEDSRAIEKEIARLDLELKKEIEKQNRRPRKTYISPVTKEVGYAMYYVKFRRRVEALGTEEFPQLDGQKLYGNLVISTPISADGQIFTKEGGVRIERSSGNQALDDAAIRIVQRSAPFEKLPEAMLSPSKDDVWVLTTTFSFTHEEAAK